jgi:hypothetical protein
LCSPETLSRHFWAVCFTDDGLLLSASCTAISSLWFAIGCVFSGLCDLAGYAFRFHWALVLPKAVLAARVLAAESQLAVELNAGKRRRRQFTPAFRTLWVTLSKVLEGWEHLVHLMKPETVKRWHTATFRLCWRWRPGRPPIPNETQQSIRRLSRENPL